MDLEVELDTHFGMAHTRWATHGEPSALNSHPHRSDKNNGNTHSPVYTLTRTHSPVYTHTHTHTVPTYTQHTAQTYTPTHCSVMALTSELVLFWLLIGQRYECVKHT